MCGISGFLGFFLLPRSARVKRRAMKAMLLCATGLWALASPHAMGASELEELRERCARQEQEIRDLRARLASVQPATDSGTPAAVTAPTPTTEPAPAATAEELIPVARPVDEAALAAASGKTHTVVSGDTFTRIASQHGVSLKALMAANPTVKATALKLGQKIVIPVAPASATSTAAPEASAAAAVTAATADASGTATSAPAQGIQQEQVERQEKIITVTITEDITYGEFAEKYGTDVQRLNSLNTLDLAPSSNLAKSSQLMVPEPQP